MYFNPSEALTKKDCLVVLYVITLISNIIKGRIEPTISNNMVHDIRVDLYKKVQKLSINSANSKTTGGLINTLNNLFFAK